MAEIVNMQQVEYDEALPRITALHENILTYVEEIRQYILTLTSGGDGFYVNQISEKVELLLDSFKGDAITALTLIFVDSELAIATLIEQVKELDKEEGN